MADLSPDVVERRLRAMARLCADAADTPTGRAAAQARLQEARRTAAIDMSPDAVDRRLRMMASLRRLCLELAAAGRSDP